MLSNEVGVATKEDPHVRLRNGLIGVTPDPMDREIVVVVDPEVIDMKRLEKDLQDQLGSSGPPVVVQEGCHSAAELVHASQIIAEGRWIPNSAEISYGSYLDAGSAQYRLTISDSGEGKSAGRSLKEELGDLVAISYGDVGRDVERRPANKSP
ncbi:MAG: hypothetical protein ACT4PP_10155 [Sporichthyaceae bacterium]